MECPEALQFVQVAVRERGGAEEDVTVVGAGLAVVDVMSAEEGAAERLWPIRRCV